MGDSEVIAGLGTRASWVKTAPNVAQRQLGNDERALVSSIGAGAQIRDVLARSGLPEARAIAVLLGMRLRGMVQPMKPPEGGGAPVRPPVAQAPASAPFAAAKPPAAAPPAAPRQATPKPKQPPAAIDAEALKEKVDLDETRRREVLEMEARLESDDFFSLLGVPSGSAGADCKKAYYDLTKKFHPDRYFGKEMGSYKARIEKIFRKLTEAQSVLSDATRRADYLAAHPELAHAPPPPAAARPAASAEAAPAPRPREDPPVDPQLAAQRAAERRARLAKHPYLAKQGKLHELMARGRESLEKGEFSKAYTDLSLAQQIDPKNPEIAALLSRAKKGGDVRRAESEFKEAQSAETMGDTVNALIHYRTAVSLAPENVEYASKAGRALAAHGGEAELKEAHVLLRKATELAPKNVEYRLAFAKLLLRAGLDKNAQRELEAVLKLDPENAQAREQARKLKWKI